MTEAFVDFCGEIYQIDPEAPLIVGREGDIVIDDNPYLHRRFLEVREQGDMLWLTNLGSQLSATISDDAGLMQAWLSPGARIPLVFSKTFVWFTAGPTTYELEIHQAESTFHPVRVELGDAGATTVGRVSFTPDQKLLIVALAEQVLRRGARGTATIPTSQVAADRLGWTITKFNRKLDNVCQKLAKQGIRGLHGDADRLASNRRARLVEYVVAARLISVDDLPLLEAPQTDSD